MREEDNRGHLEDKNELSGWKYCQNGRDFLTWIDSTSNFVKNTTVWVENQTKFIKSQSNNHSWIDSFRSALVFVLSQLFCLASQSEKRKKVQELSTYQILDRASQFRVYFQEKIRRGERIWSIKTSSNQVLWFWFDYIVSLC